MAVKTKAEKPKVEKVEKVFVPIIKEYFILDFAPMGICHCTIIVDGKPRKIEIKDQKVTPPKKDFRSYFAKGLLDAGFKKVSYVENKALRIEKEEVRKVFEFTMMHPDSGAENTKEGKFTITVNDEDKEYILEKGCVVIRDEAVKEELIKQGFAEIGKKEIKDE